MKNLYPNNDIQLGRGIYTNGTDYDWDFVRLCAATPVLTFDENYLNAEWPAIKTHTPFKEVRLARVEELLPEEHQSLNITQVPANDIGFGQYINILLAYIECAIGKFYDAKKKYVFFHSGGFDSRIISGVMAKMRRTQGIEFDNVHFHCLPDETKEFLQIMKAEGWPKEQYSIYRPKNESNFYDIGHTRFHCNGFNAFTHQMNFWSDIIPEAEEHEYEIINGIDGEFFMHTARDGKAHGWYSTNRNLDRFLCNIAHNGTWDGIWLNRFANVNQPYMDYDFLRMAGRVRREWCIYHKELETDSIRRAMAHQLGLAGIPHGRHGYTWNLDDGAVKRMKKTYAESCFYADIAHKAQALRIGISPEGIHGWDARMWGFMTSYDALKAL